MLLPLLSANDPTTNSEGTLDPLGLYLIADALGIKLIPGIRERMTHPRFLTLTAVSPAWRREVMPILHRLISRHEPGGGCGGHFGPSGALATGKCRRMVLR